MLRSFVDVDVDVVDGVDIAVAADIGVAAFILRLRPFVYMISL